MESPHDVTVQHAELLKEVLGWLDKYLGPSGLSLEGLAGCGKVGFVIPNPRRLRGRDLCCSQENQGKSRFPTPVQNRTGFGMTYF